MVSYRRRARASAIFRNPRPAGRRLTGVSRVRHATVTSGAQDRGGPVVPTKPTQPDIFHAPFQSQVDRASRAVSVLCAAPASAQMLINGAGATFPFPIYSKWFNEYAKVDPSVRFNYQSIDRKSTRLNSSHLVISYAVFCLKKKTQHLHPPGGPLVPPRLRRPGPVQAEAGGEPRRGGAPAFFFLMIRRPPRSTLLPYTPPFR